MRATDARRSDMRCLSHAFPISAVPLQLGELSPVLGLLEESSEKLGWVVNYGAAFQIIMTHCIRLVPTCKIHPQWASAHIALYSRTLRSYSRSLEHSISSRRQIFSRMRRPQRMRRANPNRTSSRMPMSLIVRINRSLARARLGSSSSCPGCSYSA
jgi:hypothetical protein